jgi:hypothetical protein
MIPFQKAYCLKMLDKIEKRPISVFFRDPMSSETEYMSGYLERPKKPMDLRAVRKAVLDGTYKTINEWGADIRLIWSNAQYCYPQDSPISMMAAELSAWFEKKSTEYPRSEQENWMKKVKKLRVRVRELHETMPIKRELIPPAESSKG